MTTGPIPAFPRRKERHTTASNTAGMSSRPLGRDGEGLSGEKGSPPIQDKRQWENNTKRFAAFQGFAPTRQSGRSRKTSPIQSPIPAFPKGKEHHTSPILTFPKGKEPHPTPSNTAKWNSRPLGRAWGGASSSSSNSVGVAFSQPRVAGEARYPG